MTKEAYADVIKESGKFILMVDNRGDFTEIQRVFNTPEDAHEYASARVRPTKDNRIDIYRTTGLENTIIDGIICRKDIEPYQEHHIGLNW